MIFIICPLHKAQPLGAKLAANILISPIKGSISDEVEVVEVELPGSVLPVAAVETFVDVVVSEASGSLDSTVVPVSSLTGPDTGTAGFRKGIYFFKRSGMLSFLSGGNSDPGIFRLKSLLILAISIKI